MTRSPLCLLVFALLVLPATVRPAAAAWPHDPNSGNVPVSTATGAQDGAMSVSDGAGGVIIAWGDLRAGGTRDIYAQRLDAAGAPLWTANGVALCVAAGEQNTVTILSDGAGGAIVSWNDARGGPSSDIYAQRVSSAGDPLWTANGVAVSTAANNQYFSSMATDGDGGAIITWYDNRSGVPFDIYAQRLDAAGTPLWTADGVPVSAATGDQFQPTIASDGSGGAIVTWYDSRSGANYDIYAQRINEAGVPQWTAGGLLICNAGDNQYEPAVIADGAGGAIIAWYDLRSTVAYDIYAQRVTGAGTALWAANGVAVCVATSSQYFPTLASDGTGGAIVSWHDFRNGGGADIYAQRISAGGFAQWTANGVALCVVTGEQNYPMAVSDDAGGAIVSWFDRRSSAVGDIYAQRINAAGAVSWAANGVALCTAPGDQTATTIVKDGAGGAIVAWTDSRSGAGTDIYAQRIERFGMLGDPAPAVVSVSDIANDQGGSVKVTWSGSYLDVDPTYGVAEYRVFRSVPGPLAAAVALSRGVTDESDVAVSEGRLLVRPAGATVTSWEYVGSHAAETFPLYSRVVATPADSVAEGNPLTWFMVEARATTALNAARWYSAPASGYSVDNLAPAMPAPLTGQYAAGVATLHWNRNTEADLAGYRLYRGIGTAFVPSAANLVGALPDTGYVDVAGSPYVYKLTAVDAHGNESPVATLVLGGTLGVDGALPQALRFAAPNPNPARGVTTLRYTLSRAGHVRLAVYDAAGRRVQLLQDAEQPAGTYEQSFALRDVSGGGLASGLYLVRLEAEGRVLTRRLATIR